MITATYILNVTAKEAENLRRELGHAAAGPGFDQIADAVVLTLAGREHEIGKNNAYAWISSLILGLSLEEARKLVSALKDNPRTPVGLSNLDLRPPKEYRW